LFTLIYLKINEYFFKFNIVYSASELLELDELDEVVIRDVPISVLEISIRSRFFQKKIHRYRSISIKTKTMSICVYVYMCIYVYVCTHTRMCIHTYMYVYMHMRVSVFNIAISNDNIANLKYRFKTKRIFVPYFRLM
jgi:hypothetical protein